MLVCRKVDVLHEIGAIEKVRKLDRLRVNIYVNIEVTGNDEVEGLWRRWKEQTRID